MRRNDARELWLRLKAQGWKQVDPQWGVDVCCADDREYYRIEPVDAPGEPALDANRA
jgi:hypothetical protein